MYRVPWNVLLGPILGIFAALIGAIIGGRYVLRTMEVQRNLDRLAAGRALSAELELNIVATATLAIAGYQKPHDYLLVRPPLMRAAFDDRLTLLSELLSPAAFLSLVSLYARAALSFSLLETQAGRGAEFTTGAVSTFTSHAEEFAIAAQAIAALVWPEDQQRQLKDARNKTLAEIPRKP